MAWFPIFVELGDCLVVGGGTVAARKAAVLADYGARVTVVARETCAELRALAFHGATASTAASAAVVSDGAIDATSLPPSATSGVIARDGAVLSHAVAPVSTQQLAGSVAVVIKPFAPDDVDGMDYVVAATDDGDCNRAVATACRARHIPVNVVDEPALCDFYFPALVRRGALVVGVGTGGKSPAFARAVKQHIDALLPQDLGTRLEAAGAERKRLLREGLSPAASDDYKKAVTLA